MDKQRVLLVHPGIYTDADPRSFPPWGAISVGHVLRAAGHEVLVLDLNGQDVATALTAALESFDPTVAGFTAKQGLGAVRFREGVDFLARVTPGLPVIAGGPLVSTFPDPESPLWRGVRALVLGDGEDVTARWVGAAERPSGLVHGDEPPNLDAVGIPVWWPGLPSYVHPAESWPGMGVPGLHVASARGCTRRCTFCYLNAHHPDARFRFISARRLYTDLAELSETTSATGFYFVDDCFIDRSQRRAEEFCALNTSDGSPFRYGCDVQLTDLDRHMGLLATMHDAGFRSLYVGVETASAATRKRLGKGSIRRSAVDVLNAALDAGFTIRASIGIGWPGETGADARATLALIDAVPRLAFDAFKYYPLPGTPLGESSYWARARTELSPQEYAETAGNDYSEHNANFSEIADADYEALWQEMRLREDERLAAYHASA
ncbi:B12-binding domain-containing radical SAM protein [Lentzea sp. NPDC060358]|uniref:B12-binding domain-containing radical SAM protein n=1 Tax=Lentzea sp. NPDC060358 TaxID=3347103 RepID=UPI0036476064